MKENIETKQYDAVVIGGSYSGLAAAMALGRALMNVLVIDSGMPCNRQTPYSHNFLTQDGSPPAAVTASAVSQVERYSTVSFLADKAGSVTRTKEGFEVSTVSGKKIISGRLIFATGIQDILPEIKGVQECWGISVLHCPYCHGYEVKNLPTGIIGNGESGFELAKLISNWTPDLTLFTNGASALSPGQTALLNEHNIKVNEDLILELNHESGQVTGVRFADEKSINVSAIYIKAPFSQHCSLPLSLGCEVTPEGYLVVNPNNETTVKDVYACGDNCSRMRTVANAVSSGTATGMAVSKSIIQGKYNA